MQNKIKCPHCGKEFEPTDALKHEITEKVSLTLEKELREKIKNENNLELIDLKKALNEQKAKIDEFREKELELRERSRKLEDREKDLELETQRRIDEEKRRIEEDTAKRLIDEHHLKDLEKDKKMNDMQNLIEELKRTSQQNSMQTQGEVGELELEKTLRELFPTDVISEVKKGELGGDVRQVVRTIRGTECGLILWERKRTKAWTDDWVKKLKEDMHRDKASIGAIVTDTLPKDFKEKIGEKEGVWITTSFNVTPLSQLLRKVVYEVAKEKSVKDNKQTKAEEVYDFITSSNFASQVERMVGIYKEMNDQIQKERIVAERQWKLREMQVTRLSAGVSGIYGSLQGIAGSALPQVKSLELTDGES